MSETIVRRRLGRVLHSVSYRHTASMGQFSEPVPAVGKSWGP